MKLIEPDVSAHFEVFEGIPAAAGYYFPPEWAKHEACWLSWPHNTDTWPGKIDEIWPAYLEFIKILAMSEKVKINVGSPEMAKTAFTKIKQHGAELDQIYFYLNPTNDAWCRDHGPSFLVNRDPQKPKIIVDWGYNAWGGKYPPYNLDNQIPCRVAGQLGLHLAKPGIIMEGGSVDFNGNGVVISSKACLLNPNRNPDLKQAHIEQKLRDYYGIDHILWIEDGIEGDDTDGHIDDTVRFVNESTVITMVEKNHDDFNREPLLVNRKLLEEMTINESRLAVVDIQMPEPLYFDGKRLPASYANFYISNEHVIVPVFNSKNDDQALTIIQDCFPRRKVVGIDSTHLVWGLGSFHCLSQQEPV